MARWLTCEVSHKGGRSDETLVAEKTSASLVRDRACRDALLMEL